MIVDQNYIEETLGIIFYLKLIYMKQIGEINWSPIPMVALLPSCLGLKFSLACPIRTYCACSIIPEVPSHMRIWSTDILRQANDNFANFTFKFFAVSCLFPICLLSIYLNDTRVSLQITSFDLICFTAVIQFLFHLEVGIGLKKV